MIHCISQIAEQANKLSAFHNVSAFNYPEMQELEKIAAFASSREAFVL